VVDVTAKEERPRTRGHRRRWFSLALTCLVLAGCGGSGDATPSGTLTGKVTLNGQPFSEGQVSVYSPERGIGASAPLDAQGQFTIGERLPAGTYGVAVVPPPEPPPQDENPASAPPVTSNIPQKYRDHQTSGITVEIKEGKNELEIQMTP